MNANPSRGPEPADDSRGAHARPPDDVGATNDARRRRRRKRKARAGDAGETHGSQRKSLPKPAAVLVPVPPPAHARPARAAVAADAPITHWKGFALNPFQIEAVAAIRGGHNVLVSAPTGAGKTLVAEYAIEDSVRRGRRCIYTSPIKALSNQKYRDFRDDPNIDVGLLTGDVTIHPTGQVLIMTTEILRNSIFDNPEYLEDVEYVVFDEVHYMDDLERGSVWEESLIFAPPNVRFICLSATISNLDELGAWLAEIRGHDIVVVKSTKRPVPLTHRVYTAKSGVVELKDLERARKREQLESGRKGHSKGPRRLRPSGRRGRDGRGDDYNEPANPRALLDLLEERRLLPVLVFAFSRKDCERMALANARRELLDADERMRMDELQQELVRLFQLDPSELMGELFSMTRRGIGYHHAGMLPIHKELVERMFTSGLLKMIFTTETFALGINMPARTVVFSSLRKFDGVNFDYLHTRDYMQMAGRAGRQGIDQDGLVFSLLSTKDLVEAPLQRIMVGTPEPVESRFRLSFSSLLHLLERLGRNRVGEAWEKSFNQFQHRAATRKQQEHNRREQRRILEAHIAFLDELGYIEGDTLTPRGNIAKTINGYELQITELLFSGALENLPVAALAVVFVGLIFEERRRGETRFISPRLFGNVRSQVQREIHHLALRAADHQLMSTVKLPDWGLTEDVVAWMEGVPFEEIAEKSEATPGDIVRNLRMAVQLMRQVRRAIDPSWDLRDHLGEAMDVINRDVVDARRQLELG